MQHRQQRWTFGPCSWLHWSTALHTVLGLESMSWPMSWLHSLILTLGLASLAADATRTASGSGSTLFLFLVQVHKHSVT